MPLRLRLTSLVLRSKTKVLSGPPLGDREYRLAQVHAHWDTDDCNQGSEHQINGKSFAAEIHFVHWNCTNFRSLEEASKHKHGLAVLGVLVMALEGEQNKNKHLDKIVSALRHVKSPNSSTELRSKLDLKKLFPGESLKHFLGSSTMMMMMPIVSFEAATLTSQSFEIKSNQINSTQLNSKPIAGLMRPTKVP